MSKKQYTIFFAIGLIAILFVIGIGSTSVLQSRRAPVITVPPDIAAQLIARREKALALIKENDQQVVPYVELATVERALGNTDAAIDALRRASLVSPKNHLVWGNLAVVYMEKRMNREADGAFKSAIEYGKKELNNYLQYAEFLQYRYPKRRKNIIRIYETGMKELGEDSTLVTAFARYLTVIGDDANALREWRTALAHDPHNVEIQREMIVLQERIDATAHE